MEHCPLQHLACIGIPSIGVPWGEASGKVVCVVGGIGGAGLLASAFCVGTLLEQNPSLVSVAGCFVLDFF